MTGWMNAAVGIGQYGQHMTEAERQVELARLWRNAGPAQLERAGEPAQAPAVPPPPPPPPNQPALAHPPPNQPALAHAPNALAHHDHPLQHPAAPLHHPYVYGAQHYGAVPAMPYFGHQQAPYGYPHYYYQQAQPAPQAQAYYPHQNPIPAYGQPVPPVNRIQHRPPTAALPAPVVPSQQGPTRFLPRPGTATPNIHLGEGVYMVRAWIANPVAQTSLQFATNESWSTFSERCRTKLDDPNAVLGFRLTLDPKRKAPFALTDEEEFREAMSRLAKMCSASSSVEKEIFIENTRKDAEPLTANAKGKKRSRNDDIPPSMPEDLDDIDKANWASLENALRCEQHTRSCVIDKKGGPDIHIPISYNFKEIWIKYIRNGRATVISPPHCLFLEIEKLKRRMRAEKASITGITPRIVSEVHLNINSNGMFSVPQPHQGRTSSPLPSSSQNESSGYYSFPGSLPSTPVPKRPRSSLMPSPHHRRLSSHTSITSHSPPLPAPQFTSGSTPHYPTVHDALVQLHECNPGAGYLDMESALLSIGLEYVDQLSKADVGFLEGCTGLRTEELEMACIFAMTEVERVDEEEVIVNAHQQKADWSEQIFEETENYRNGSEGSIAAGDGGSWENFDFGGTENHEHFSSGDELLEK